MIDDKIANVSDVDERESTVVVCNSGSDAMCRSMSRVRCTKCTEEIRMGIAHVQGVERDRYIA